MMTGHSLLAVP